MAIFNGEGSKRAPENMAEELKEAQDRDFEFAKKYNRPPNQRMPESQITRDWQKDHPLVENQPSNPEDDQEKSEMKKAA